MIWTLWEVQERRQSDVGTVLLSPVQEATCEEEQKFHYIYMYEINVSFTAV